VIERAGTDLGEPRHAKYLLRNLSWRGIPSKEIFGAAPPSALIEFVRAAQQNSRLGKVSPGARANPPYFFSPPHAGDRVDVYQGLGTAVIFSSAAYGVLGRRGWKLSMNVDSRSDMITVPIQRLPPVGLKSGSGRVDLWCFYYERISEARLFRAYEGLMTADERARHKRFHFERDRLMFLATRALVRTVLSAYADVAPSEWLFSERDRGKPYVTGPAGVPPLHFNLTNTRGLVVCAVSRDYPQVGVDAEWLERPGETVGVVDSYFSPTEIMALRALPPGLQRNRFFHLWTLKESYIKARGLGLALPLEQFSFLLDDGLPIRVAFDPRLADDPGRWRFALLPAYPCHMVAVSVDTGGAPLTLSASNYVPLLGALPFPEAS
jgi:4'-phosphopantetheinyl transferase